MYIDAFKVFCDLVETNSFSKAAALNNLTQSAVSQQVRNIETRLGCKLVERAGRSISLSPEGQAFLRACRAMIRSWENLKGELSDLKNEVSGRLRIASIYSIGLHELPPRLKRFQDEFPDVEVQVAYKRSAQVYELVERGEADMGLVAFPVRRGGLVHEIFNEDRLVLICHPKHELASRKRIALSQIDGIPFVGFEPDTPTRKGIDRQLREAGVKVAHAAEFDNVEMVKRAVEIESGVSIVPWTTVQAEVESGQLASVEIDAPRMSRPLGLLLKKGRTRPAGLKELIAILKDSRKG